MGVRLQLLGRFVWPLATFGLVLGLVVFWALFDQQQQVMVRELKDRAAVVAGAVVRNSQRYASAVEALESTLSSTGEPMGATSIHIVELSRQQLIASTEHGSSFLPVFSGESSWKEGHMVSFALPVTLDADRIPGVVGRDLQAVVTLDSSSLAQVHENQLLILMFISLFGGMAFIAGVLFLFRRLVLDPVAKIQRAVQAADRTGSWRLPTLHEDELGRLSKVLEKSVRSLSEQEQFTRSVFESLSGVAYRADARTGEILLSSGGLSSLVGEGALHEDLFGGEDGEAYDRFRLAVRLGEMWSFQYEHDAGDSTIWISHRGRAVYGRNGKPLYFDGLLLDITEQKRRDDELALMSEAISASSNEFYLLDGDTLAIQTANQAALDNLGYTLEELVSLNAVQVAPKLAEQSVVEAVSDQLQATGEIQYAYGHLRKDGSEYPFEFTASAVARNGQHWIVVFGADVSEREQQQESIRVSEERLSLALEGTDYGIFDYSTAEKDLYLSDSVRVWFDDANAEIDTLGAVSARLDPSDLEVLWQQLETRSGNEGTFSGEARLRGQDMWLHLQARALFSDDGDLLRMSGFAADVTQQKSAEALVQKTVSRLEAVLEHVAEGIVSVTQAGTITTANSAFVDMFGGDRDVIIGSAISAWFVDEFNLFDLSNSKPCEMQGLRAEGKTLSCEMAVRRMGGNSRDKYTIVVRDTTEQKRVERELREAMSEARAAERAKGEFLATMSHEIRTPMNGVLGMTQLLMDMNLSQEQKDTARVILSSGEALLAIINDILDFSKIEAGKLDFETADFDLGVAIHDVMELLARVARSKQLDLYVDYPVGVPSRFVGDVGRVRQVLMNLVGNAIKFTDSGHVIVSVESLEDGEVTVRVKDTGLGLPLDVQPKLFDSFTQADASTTRKFGGTGLGLAISKKLVNLMGGEIGVVSEPGNGAEFWFSLQLPLSAEVDSDVPAPAVPMQGKRVLVVDDNPVGREILSSMLAGMGAELAAASSGAEALECLRTQTYDLAVLDYHMPGMDGMELLAEIRRDSGLQGLSILMLSSSEVPVADGLVRAVKPVMRDQLATLAERAMQGQWHVSDGRPADVSAGEQELIQGLRVLLAEDNVVNQKVAVRMLEKLGCRVDIAANGEEAVQMWREFPYTMIFMDCQMPELDGLEATRRIRSLETEGHIPIVAMTANAMARDREACIEAGMDDYASKPIKTSVLSVMLERYANQP